MSCAKPPYFRSQILLTSIGRLPFCTTKLTVLQALHSSSISLLCEDCRVQTYDPHLSLPLYITIANKNYFLLLWSGLYLNHFRLTAYSLYGSIYKYVSSGLSLEYFRYSNRRFSDIAVSTCFVTPFN